MTAANVVEMLAVIDDHASEKSRRVRALTRVEPTLEDVFLAATRRSWDATAPKTDSGKKSI